ncbi:MAG: hypothetical protein GX414_06415 [Acidobacteria bacterium]|nr:hypothetical protein [Acidobacteriota bacterium]
MRNSWFLPPSRPDTNASQRPSGDHFGLPAPSSPRVSWKVRPVAVSANQICGGNASFLKSGVSTE